MFSTSVGLILQGYENMKKRDENFDTTEIYIPEPEPERITEYSYFDEPAFTEERTEEEDIAPKKKQKKEKKENAEKKTSITDFFMTGLANIFAEKDDKLE